MPEKDGWIENLGGADKKPVQDGVFYLVRFRNGKEILSEPKTSWRWDHNGHTHDIVAFKIIK